MAEQVQADRKAERSTRTKAIWVVRLATFGGLAGALGLTWAFSNLAEAYFSGKPPAPPRPPQVPLAAAPVQKPPAEVVTVVHHPAPVRGVAPAPAGGAAPRPPAQGPAPPPPPPPPPVCHSTPSKPC